MELGNFPAELEIEDSLHNFTQTPNMLCTEFIERYPNLSEAKFDFRIKVCKVGKKDTENMFQMCFNYKFRLLKHVWRTLWECTMSTIDGSYRQISDRELKKYFNAVIKTAFA